MNSCRQVGIACLNANRVLPLGISNVEEGDIRYFIQRAGDYRPHDLLALRYHGNAYHRASGMWEPIPNGWYWGGRNEST